MGAPHVRPAFVPIAPRSRGLIFESFELCDDCSRNGHPTNGWHDGSSDVSIRVNST